jgi:hypothetical protein
VENLNLPPCCPSCGAVTARLDHDAPDASDAPAIDGALLQVWPADPDDENLPESWLWTCSCGFQAEPTAERAGQPPTIAAMLGKPRDVR